MWEWFKYRCCECSRLIPEHRVGKTDWIYSIIPVPQSHLIGVTCRDCNDRLLEYMDEWGKNMNEWEEEEFEECDYR
jgi:hypothetical protein